MGMLKGSSRTLVSFFWVTVLLFSFSSVAWSAQSDYNGAYAGTYTGDDNGYWIAVADSSGTYGIEGAFVGWSTDNNSGDAGSLTWWGGMDPPTGNYWTSSTEIQGSYVDAYINNSTFHVTGNWSNSTSLQSGSLEGDKLNASAYAGNYYSGFFCGDDTGAWNFTIGADGSVTGTMSPDSGGSYNFIGVCHPAGYVLGIGDAGGTAFGFFSQISGSTITGQWLANDVSGSSGTISTSPCTAGGGGGGDGGGGGGCFILSLVGDLLAD